jgi:NDP-sugar pyrophosphorylase family protein
VKAVLLAAGLGTRLRAATGELPKILAPLSGHTLLDRQLAYLARQGITEVAVNLHHRAEAVVAHLERVAPPLPVRFSVEEELLGTAGALRPLAGFLEEPFVLLYGDVLTDLDLGELASRHVGIATLACYRTTELAGKGVLRVDERLRVLSFVEKGEEQAGEGLVNAGIHVLEPAILDFVTAPPCDFGRDLWPAALAAGAEITAAPIDGYLLDVGTPETLAAAERDVEAGRL